jgi:hypothetical protein
VAAGVQEEKMPTGMELMLVQIEEREPPQERQSALEYLQSIYRNPLVPVPMRMRAAALAVPFESPKLTAIANLSPEDFSKRLERAITRSGVRLIEAKGET